MPIPVTDVGLLQQYLNGVMTKADHHANSVNEIALAVAGAIVWRKDSDPIEVMPSPRGMGNVLWAKINGKRYAFSYNHQAGAIEIRRGTTHGQVVCSLSNSTSLAQLRRDFAAL
jgi:hypothetical protein